MDRQGHMCAQHWICLSRRGCFGKKGNALARALVERMDGAVRAVNVPENWMMRLSLKESGRRMEVMRILVVEHTNRGFRVA